MQIDLLFLNNLCDSYCILTLILTFLFFDLRASVPGPIEQSVMSSPADPGITSLILAWSFTFVEIDHEIISTAILLPFADSRRVVVSYK